MTEGEFNLLISRHWHQAVVSRVIYDNPFIIIIILTLFIFQLNLRSVGHLINEMTMALFLQPYIWVSTGWKTMSVNQSEREEKK